MHIVDVLYYWARTAPMRPAVIEAGGVVTYAGLAEAVEAAAEQLAASITNKSKPVALSVRSGSKMLIGLLGLLRGGFDVALVHQGLLKELSAIGTTTLVFERDTPTLDGGENIVFNEAWLKLALRADTGNKPLPITKTQGGNIICFTSGTTGRPKPVVCPPASWQHRVLFPLNSAFFSYERMLIVPGLITSWALSRAYEALHAGRTLCLAEAGLSTLWMADTYEVDTMLVSPQQALELVDLQEKATRFPLRALKSVQIGAAAISRDGVRRIRQNLCRNVIVIYGTSEAGVVAVAPFEMIADRPGAVGYILPGVDVEIVDAVGHTLPRGEEGFVRVRSHVFSENMAASRSSDQWFYTSDYGRVTDDGMLHIAGRTTEVVNRGGEKLALADIDDYLRGCAGVQDAGVCTVKGPAGFDQVWVGLVPAPAADLGAMRFTIEANPRYKNNIDKIFVVEVIPRGTLGKIQRDELKKVLLEIDQESEPPR